MDSGTQTESTRSVNSLGDSTTSQPVSSAGDSSSVVCWQPLTHPAVSDQYHLEQIVVLLLRCTHYHTTAARSDTTLHSVLGGGATHREWLVVEKKRRRRSGRGTGAEQSRAGVKCGTASMQRSGGNTAEGVRSVEDESTTAAQVGTRCQTSMSDTSSRPEEGGVGWVVLD